MTALAAGVNRLRRGQPNAGAFGYAVAAGKVVFKGGIVAVTSTGGLQPAGIAGSVAIVGIAAQDLDNSANAAVSAAMVEALKGTFQIDVPAATHANINAAVYASDDATLTLTAGTLVAAGVLTGIEGGKTYVKIVGT